MNTLLMTSQEGNFCKVLKHLAHLAQKNLGEKGEMK